MSAQPEKAEIFHRFHKTASDFCAVVDSAPKSGRDEFVLTIYRLLPSLIGEAMRLPDAELSEGDYQTHAEMSNEQWRQLYQTLQEKLGNWDRYWQVFDPTKETEAITGSLADDIADIYRDLKNGLVPFDSGSASLDGTIWGWRLLFYSHWGAHAMDALRTIHFLVGEKLG
jgi:Domain of unknown function (DUF5063)